ncbi:MAG TPA: Asp-tRNA(Asn)/Glu-tRNA(Gln) amidotransferase subunit GatA [Candidatus Sumerlaeota bacterium]|nr:MAG: Glutamyl-tRNA(Gln) amidotransferase subunit A [candidate division BRC1 bacterium ADurb.Bin183]HOE62450.1 Asp-tRNA(Asn)/Glu-tRNA(Gln) amidotransferase subunit GatA [Candidatus Sumerlaeota bacterium]HRR30749.1 Asp-tRNA(Asn)/Glu-tRNA(Gln) amidotransferase subunit GatA [Candidatus Sumerlaeia bacterium]HON50109.1 Asp-tRNA(Asn)/Glu-tRNA(Gln) amidotransferase subunit GatA [Candidatus Sumerlaeota bacterium]HOR63325.1 Asp-tRNA(Asn)/Glu-tRNA(Gln) amidotransferase subunit GatA [Candidatus Sumerlae
MDIHTLTLAEAGKQLKQKKITSRQLTQAVLQRLKSVEPQIQAFLSIAEKTAFTQADEADRRIAEGGDISPLTGIPIAIKDNICTADAATTCASRILENFHPPYDATVIAKLRRAGVVFIGKTNMDEFAMGSSTENSGYKITRNPWDRERIPGGSSGGSAAAVAADAAIAALGSDTGGSVRAPASYCGVVGLKPTYGRVSRYGLVAYGSSLDQIGPLTKDVKDSAIMLNALAGHDPQDSTSANVPVPDYTSACGKDIKGLRIGIPKEYFAEGIDPEVEQLVKNAIRQMESLGALPIEISLPHTEYAIPCYYICAMAEASSNLARYGGAHYGYRAKNAGNILEMYSKTRAEGFGTEVKRRIMLGTYVLSAGYYDAWYLKAIKARTLIKRDFELAWEKTDIIAAPVVPAPAFKIGEKSADPLTMYLSDIYTISLNLAGMCGISIPCGFSKKGLPVGLQLIANIFKEETLFTAAYAYEQSAGFFNRKPPL